MIPERVHEVLDRHGLRALTFEPGSTPTSEMAAARIGAEVGQIAKTILMAGKDGRFRLVVLRGDQKVHTTKFKNITGCKHRMATAEETLETTGFPVGGVCPFDPGGLEVYLDQGLGRYDTIYPSAGTDASGVPLSLERLAEITGGTVCDLVRDDT
jgi:prolyl-tRNA editing enzyme YbaK/EbsC (Cys-tRNA(Pro) deacylase)